MFMRKGWLCCSLSVLDMASPIPWHGSINIGKSINILNADIPHSESLGSDSIAGWLPLYQHTTSIHLERNRVCSVREFGIERLAVLAVGCEGCSIKSPQQNYRDNQSNGSSAESNSNSAAEGVAMTYDIIDSTQDIQSSSANTTVTQSFYQH